MKILDSDSTGVLIEFIIRSATTGQPLTGLAVGDFTIQYQRDAASSITNLGSPAVLTTLGTWETDALKETSIAGLYQYGVPDACLITGANGVTLVISATGAITTQYRIILNSVTAPTIKAIKDQTDLFRFTNNDVKATLDSEKVQVSGIDTDVITGTSINTTGVTKIQTGLALEATLTALKGTGWTTESLKAIKDAVDTKLNTLSYVAPDNDSIADIKEQTEKMTFNEENEILAAGGGSTPGEIKNVTGINGLV